MIDGYGRNIDYLRMSLTSRCQQRCIYCARENGGKCVKENELSADDFIFTAETFAENGFRKIRLTGGEPLLRRDILEIVSGISALKKYDDIAMTTNGAALPGLCEPLRQAGLKRINISLDSLDDKVYESITGSSLASVKEGIYKAARTFDEVKINAVLIRGVNDDPSDLIEFARNNPLTVRFIELMPMGGAGDGISGDEILKLHPELYPVEKTDAHSPERLFTADGFKGKIGLINPLSDSFCSFCNRMRFTWDGKLRPCLGVDYEIDARSAVLARNRGMLSELIYRAVREKPRKNEFDGDFSSCRPMNGIGG